MSDFGLTNIKRGRPYFILSKLLPIIDVSIVTFMQKLDETDNRYNKSFPLWLIIVIIIGAKLVASPQIFPCI